MGKATLASGSDFDRLRWLLEGRISEAVRSGESKCRAATPIWRPVRPHQVVLGIASGWNLPFDAGESNTKFDSATYRGGFRWRPGRRTDITLTYGKSDDRFSPAAMLRYQITEFSHFLVRYFESLSTSQQRLFENVSLIGIDPQNGVFSDDNRTRAIPGQIRSRRYSQDQGQCRYAAIAPHLSESTSTKSTMRRTPCPGPHGRNCAIAAE